MKKFKPIIALVSTLIIGFVLGFLVSGQLTKQKMNDFLRWGTEDGFKEIMEEKIEPLDSQKADLDPIFEKYAKLNGELHLRWEQEHGKLMKELTQDLGEILTPEQMKEWNGHEK